MRKGQVEIVRASQVVLDGDRADLEVSGQRGEGKRTADPAREELANIYE